MEEENTFQNHISSLYIDFYTIFKENYLLQHLWAEFFFLKMPAIFNTSNTCNKIDKNKFKY